MTRLPDPERSRAFLFGAATYRYDYFPDLPAVANNLRDLRTALTPPLGGFAARHSTVLLDPQAPLKVYESLAHHAGQATDTLLVYFAGHGFRKVNGDLQLAVTDTQYDSSRFSAFDYETLREIVDESGAANKIVILDCCFSGRAIRGMSATATALEQRTEIDGACVLVSTTDNAEALAPPGATHTLYTRELLHLLRDGVPQAGDLLSLGTLAEHLRRSPRLRGLQTPGHRFDNSTRDLALARNAAAPGATAARRAKPAPPPPRITAEEAYVARPLVFAGARHATKKELAATIRTHWRTAADRFFRNMGPEAHPSEGWSELRSWLRQFDNTRCDDVEGRIVLVDRHLTQRNLPADHKLLHLLRWLDPDGPVVYRGSPVTYESLVHICLDQCLGSGGDKRFFEELYEGPLLDILARFGALRGLRGVRKKWIAAVKEWKGQAGAAHVPTEVYVWAVSAGPGALLVALLPPKHLARVRHRLPAAARPPDPAANWYTRLLPATGGGQTPLGRLFEAQWSERAQRDGEMEAREREARRRVADATAEQRRVAAREREEQRQRAAREQRDRQLTERQEAERQRLRERERRTVREARGPGAVALGVFRACLLTGVWFLVPALAVWLTWWYGSYEFDGARVLTLMAAVVSCSALFRLAPCAYRLGGAFRPRLREPWSWLPPGRASFTTGALLLGYGLIGGDTSLRSGDIAADSDLLRTVGLGRFLDHVGRNGYATSGWATLLSLLLLPLCAGCVLAGLHAGRAMARRWEEHPGRAPGGRARLR
ncbi:caspase family protein [Streptomyces sp. NPDC007929]|uniref:caspase family protein n=1 Tax=unclassified Streptomyces TaxID=2593676 RepID=UPI0036E07ECE